MTDIELMEWYSDPQSESSEVLLLADELRDQGVYLVFRKNDKRVRVISERDYERLRQLEREHNDWLERVEKGGAQ